MTKASRGGEEKRHTSPTQHIALLYYQDNPLELEPRGKMGEQSVCREELGKGVVITIVSFAIWLKHVKRNRK